MPNGLYFLILSKIKSPIDGRSQPRPKVIGHIAIKAIDGVLSGLVGQLVVITVLNGLELPSLIDRGVKRYADKLKHLEVG